VPAHSPPLCRPFGRPKHPGDIDKGDHDGDWQRSFFALRTTEEWRKSKVSVIAQRNADTAGYANNQVRNTAATPATRCEALQLCAAGCKYRAAAKILIADQIFDCNLKLQWRGARGRGSVAQSLSGVPHLPHPPCLTSCRFLARTVTRTAHKRTCILNIYNLLCVVSQVDVYERRLRAADAAGRKDDAKAGRAPMLMSPTGGIDTTALKNQTAASQVR